jgi:hypothetical protein
MGNIITTAKAENTVEESFVGFREPLKKVKNGW